MKQQSQEKYLKTILILMTTALVLPSCSQTDREDNVDKTPTKLTVVSPPPLKSGQVLDPNSDYAKYWTGLPQWRSVGSLTFKIPAEFTGFWDYQNYPEGTFAYALERPAHIPKERQLGFNFFMPDMGGYTPDNYLTNEFNEDKVRVMSIKPYPLSNIENVPFPKKVIKPSAGVYEIDKYEDKYGLRCYEGSNNDSHLLLTDLQYCYGVRDEKLDEYIEIKLSVPPYADGPVFPMMQVKYITKQFGGLEVIWWAHNKNISHWHEIDQQIWKYLNEWYVADESANLNK